MNSLISLGWSDFFESSLTASEKQSMSIGRVSTVNKSNCIVLFENGIKTCELAGSLLFGSEESERPKTGDWVLFLDYGDLGIISRVLPRQNRLSRKKAGKEICEQIIAANVDYAIVVQCPEIGLNLRRLERTLVQLQNCKITPLVLINKADLEVNSEQQEVFHFILKTYKAIPLSAKSGKNIDLLEQKIAKGKSYVFIGASGVGKSSLINALRKEEKLATGAISKASNKGVHTTSSRGLYLLPEGGIVIDTPGTREFGLTSKQPDASQQAFGGMNELAEQCKFTSCTHTKEKNCRVLEALQYGEITNGEYQNFLKLQREMDHYSSSIKDRKQKGKHLSKIIKNMKKSDFKNL